VDLTISEGERVAVVGANGSGKTTLQLALGGLIEPTAGSVEYFGETTDAESVRERLGVLLQDPDDYLFNTTVREDIEYGPAQLSVPAEEAERRVEALAERLGLTDLLDRPPFRLSGGERRRAALASALAVEPDLLLLDEPVANVDAENSAATLDLLAELHADGVATVVSTPDPSLVPHVADRVYLLDRQGTVAAAGPVDEVVTDRALLEDHGLAVPQVLALFDRLDVGGCPLTVEAAAAALRERDRD
jgi:cobalt/nickel transport system ATP-binding protein